ncbi:hypothetical protein HPP92_020837 [Vanilla planifolia]|uniref:Methyltransferase type 11 domain-containing protein n=1 Tax=Vanilla planifolia TaxID=51239 RepID=A0A835Q1F1_VANPL|nr:hypothetical protein HPP92_020837 [Vanilla planifolia]
MLTKQNLSRLETIRHSIKKPYHLSWKGTKHIGDEMADLYRNHDQAQFYATYRPNYPPELFNFIASKVPHRHLAWDVGTGSGQAAIPLSSLFDSVVATDSSPEQISHAPTDIPNLRFVVTPLSLSTDDLHRLVGPPGSVDLITVATTLHWLDVPAFFDQARRVLRRPGGIIAVWCYSMDLEIEGGRKPQEIYRRVLKATNPFWEEEVRVMAEEGYAGVDFPFEAVEGVEEGTAPVMRLIGNLTFFTWLPLSPQAVLNSSSTSAVRSSTPAFLAL